MKGVIVSIQPKWCQLIANKKKVVEVRKTRPKLETPFKCYIYCTNGTQLVDVRKERIYLDIKQAFLLTNGKSNNVICSTPPQVNRKVIGEFVCDRIDRIGRRGVNDNFDYCYLSLNEWGNDDIEIEITDIEKSCISKSELNSYGANATCLYAWHISDLKIYDKPKELSEFMKPFVFEDRPMKDWCHNHCEICDEKNCKYDLRITRPPQSWCYVGVER